MKILTKSVVALGLVGCAAMNSPSAAAAEENSGWYVGGSIGQSRATIDDARITRNLLGAGITVNSIADDNRSIGYKFFGGYQFNPYLSLESGYFDLGKFGYTATTATGTVTGRLKLRGVNLDLVGSLPLTEDLSVLGRLGGTYAQTRDNFSTTGALTVVNPNPTKKAWNYKFGAGLQYDITKALSVRIEAERYRINDAVGNRGDIDLYSAGLVYRFGTSTPPAPREEVVKPEPVHVAVAPVPAPKRVPLIKVAFSADSLFVFGSAAVNPEGKQDLDRLVADLKNTKFDVIVVTGHTDRIGSHDFNMGLSRDRAEAVKTYLVDTAGVPADKVETIGVGESNPVTKPGECEGNLTWETPNDTARSLKACLAPDRRVEVEVNALEKRQ